MVDGCIGTHVGIVDSFYGREINKNSFPLKFVVKHKIIPIINLPVILLLFIFSETYLLTALQV